MRNRYIKKHAFTLVEVMLALAIVSIGLIAILGLLPTGLRSARDAADNTISATIVQDIFSTIRTQPFGNVNLSTLGLGSGYNLTNNYPPSPPVSIFTYFDQGGLTPPATVQDRYYQVTLTFSNLSPLVTPPPLALSLVTATVVWPARSIHPANTNVFVTEVAQYNQ